MQSSSQIITSDIPTFSSLQAGRPSWRPADSIRALKAFKKFGKIMARDKMRGAGWICGADMNGDNLRIHRAYLRSSDHCRVTVRIRNMVRVSIMVSVRVRVADCCIQTAGKSDKMRINHVIKTDQWRSAPLHILLSPKLCHRCQIIWKSLKTPDYAHNLNDPVILWALFCLHFVCFCLRSFGFNSIMSLYVLSSRVFLVLYVTMSCIMPVTCFMCYFGNM